MKIALLGNITLDFLAHDFRRMGHEVYVPPGFDTWRQEILDPSSGLRRFSPDASLLLLPDRNVMKVAARLDDLNDGDAPPRLETLAGETPGFWDDRMRQLAAMPFSLAGLKAIEDEFLFQVAVSPSPRKILAVDADNTLWHGIISEDGPASVVPHVDFQQGLLALKAKGILLVLLSKNDPPSTPSAPVAMAFARDDMPLSLSDFAAVGVDWSPKAGNLLKACETFNLAPDSVVFIDDNPHERVQMAAHLPEVAVPPFPSDMSHPAAFLRRIEAAFFSTDWHTAEDGVRTEMYQAEAARRKSAARLPTLSDYLESLHMTCRAAIATLQDVPRLAQMAGKTNQFNATTIRRTADEMKRIVQDRAWRVWTFRLADDFGDMGLVCYIVYSCAGARITDFVMSCRAMGRTLEHYALNHVRRALASEKLPLNGIDFVASAKNAPVKAFLASLNGASDMPTCICEQSANLHDSQMRPR